MPDYKTLSLKTQSEFTPVIPGSSWAGAFRDKCSQILTNEEITDYFGEVNETTAKAVKSQVCFSESILSGGTPKDVTRNSIDRFSGATKSGALYTERTYYYGETSLTITVPYNERLLSAIGVCLADLHHGFLKNQGQFCLLHHQHRKAPAHAEPVRPEGDPRDQQLGHGLLSGHELPRRHLRSGLRGIDL